MKSNVTPQRQHLRMKCLRYTSFSIYEIYVDVLGNEYQRIKTSEGCWGYSRINSKEDYCGWDGQLSLDGSQIPFSDTI